MESMWNCMESTWNCMESTWKCMESIWNCMESTWKCMESIWNCMESIWNCMESIWKCMESMWKCMESIVGVYGIHVEFMEQNHSIWIPSGMWGHSKVLACTEHKKCIQTGTFFVFGAFSSPLLHQTQQNVPRHPLMGHV